MFIRWPGRSQAPKGAPEAKELQKTPKKPGNIEKIAKLSLQAIAPSEKASSQINSRLKELSNGDERYSQLIDQGYKSLVDWSRKQIEDLDATGRAETSEDKIAKTILYSESSDAQESMAAQFIKAFIGELLIKYGEEIVKDRDPERFEDAEEMISAVINRLIEDVFERLDSLNEIEENLLNDIFSTFKTPDKTTKERQIRKTLDAIVVNNAGKTSTGAVKQKKNEIVKLLVQYHAASGETRTQLKNEIEFKVGELTDLIKSAELIDHFFNLIFAKERDANPIIALAGRNLLRKTLRKAISKRLAEYFGIYREVSHLAKKQQDKTHFSTVMPALKETTDLAESQLNPALNLVNGASHTFLKTWIGDKGTKFVQNILKNVVEGQLKARSPLIHNIEAVIIGGLINLESEKTVKEEVIQLIKEFSTDLTSDFSDLKPEMVEFQEIYLNALKGSDQETVLRQSVVRKILEKRSALLKKQEKELSEQGAKLWVEITDKKIKGELEQIPLVKRADYLRRKHPRFSKKGGASYLQFLDQYNANLLNSIIVGHQLDNLETKKPEELLNILNPISGLNEKNWYELFQSALSEKTYNVRIKALRDLGCNVVASEKAECFILNILDKKFKGQLSEKLYARVLQAVSLATPQISEPFARAAFDYNIKVDQYTAEAEIAKDYLKTISGGNEALILKPIERMIQEGISRAQEEGAKVENPLAKRFIDALMTDETFGSAEKMVNDISVVVLARMLKNVEGETLVEKMGTLKEEISKRIENSAILLSEESEDEKQVTKKLCQEVIEIFVSEGDLDELLPETVKQFGLYDLALDGMTELVSPYIHDLCLQAEKKRSFQDKVKESKALIREVSDYHDGLIIRPIEVLIRHGLKYLASYDFEDSTINGFVNALVGEGGDATLSSFLETSLNDVVIVVLAEAIKRGDGETVEERALSLMTKMSVPMKKSFKEMGDFLEKTSVEKEAAYVRAIQQDEKLEQYAESLELDGEELHTRVIQYKLSEQISRELLELIVTKEQLNEALPAFSKDVPIFDILAGQIAQQFNEHFEQIRAHQQLLDLVTIVGDREQVQEAKKNLESMRAGKMVAFIGHIIGKGKDAALSTEDLVKAITPLVGEDAAKELDAENIGEEITNFLSALFGRDYRKGPSRLVQALDLPEASAAKPKSRTGVDYLDLAVKEPVEEEEHALTADRVVENAALLITNSILSRAAGKTLSEKIDSISLGISNEIDKALKGLQKNAAEKEEMISNFEFPKSYLDALAEKQLSPREIIDEKVKFILIQELSDGILSILLPEEIRDTPVYEYFKSDVQTYIQETISPHIDIFNNTYEKITEVSRIQAESQIIQKAYEEKDKKKLKVAVVQKILDRRLELLFLKQQRKSNDDAAYKEITSQINDVIEAKANLSDFDSEKLLKIATPLVGIGEFDWQPRLSEAMDLDNPDERLEALKNLGLDTVKNRSVLETMILDLGLFGVEELVSDTSLTGSHLIGTIQDIILKDVFSSIKGQIETEDTSLNQMVTGVIHKVVTDVNGKMPHVIGDKRFLRALVINSANIFGEGVTPEDEEKYGDASTCAEAMKGRILDIFYPKGETDLPFDESIQPQVWEQLNGALENGIEELLTFTEDKEAVNRFLLTQIYDQLEVDDTTRSLGLEMTGDDLAEEVVARTTELAMGIYMSYLPEHPSLLRKFLSPLFALVGWLIKSKVRKFAKNLVESVSGDNSEIMIRKLIMETIELLDKKDFDQKEFRDEDLRQAYKAIVGQFLGKPFKLTSPLVRPSRIPWESVTIENLLTHLHDQLLKEDENLEKTG